MSHNQGSLDRATTTLPGATAYIGSDSKKRQYANYFYYDGSDGASVFQAALNYIDTTDGGILHVEPIALNITSDVSIPTGFANDNRLIIRGEGRPNNEWYPTTSGGSILNFSSSARFLASGDTNFDRVLLEDIGLRFNGTYTGYAWSFDRVIVNVRNFGLWIQGSYAVDACAIGNWGSGGASAENYMWDNILVVDGRTSGGRNKHLIYFYPENMSIRNLTLLVNCANPVSPSSYFKIYSVGVVSIDGFSIYMSSGWNTTSGNYVMHQFSFMNNMHVRLDNIQYFYDSDVIDDQISGYVGYHIAAPYSGTTVYVNGSNPIDAEGEPGYRLPSTGGSGTVHLLFKGHGYDDDGTVTMLSGQNSIAATYDLLAAPTAIHHVATKSGLGALYATVVTQSGMTINCEGQAPEDTSIYYNVKLRRKTNSI